MPNVAKQTVVILWDHELIQASRALQALCEKGKDYTAEDI